MTIELNEYIEKLRPVAEFRSKLVIAMRGPFVTLESRKKERQSLSDSQTLLIREAQRYGMLPAFLIPLLWKLLYSVAWQSIQYWLSKLHQPEVEA